MSLDEAIKQTKQALWTEQQLKQARNLKDTLDTLRTGIAPDVFEEIARNLEQGEFGPVLRYKGITYDIIVERSLYPHFLTWRTVISLRIIPTHVRDPFMHWGVLHSGADLLEYLARRAA